VLDKDQRVFKVDEIDNTNVPMMSGSLNVKGGKKLRVVFK
jgi:hypothetical protein